MESGTNMVKHRLRNKRGAMRAAKGGGAEDTGVGLGMGRRDDGGRRFRYSRKKK